MFSLGDGTKFWLYTKPTDMRKNFNMLSGIVNGHMGQNLYSGDDAHACDASDRHPLQSRLP